MNPNIPKPQRRIFVFALSIIVSPSSRGRRGVRVVQMVAQERSRFPRKKKVDAKPELGWRATDVPITRRWVPEASPDFLFWLSYRDFNYLRHDDVKISFRAGCDR
jgi:hypothetical protein